MNFRLDDYADLDSIIHRWNPRLKLVGLFGLIFAFASVETLALIPVMGVSTLALYGASGLPFAYLRRRLRYPGMFLLGIILLLPWLSGETVLWQWGWLTLRLEGCLTVALIASRFLCILTVGLVLLGTMPFLTTLKAMRSLGLPALLADMTLLTYRYLYEVAENLTTMRRAMGLRGFGSNQRNHHSKRLAFVPDGRDLNLLASLTGSLFIRSYEQSERIYKAMRLRGYGQHSTVSRSTVSPRGAIASARPLPIWADGLLEAGALLLALGLLGAEWFLY